jgi:RNA-directed DNA polymerase
VHGTESDAHALREEVATALAPMGLRLSQSKTSVRHMRDGFDFLGFHIQWKRKRGTQKWYVYTFIADRPIKALKAKLRALTHRTSLADLGATLVRLNQILRFSQRVRFGESGCDCCTRWPGWSMYPG